MNPGGALVRVVHCALAFRGANATNSKLRHANSAHRRCVGLIRLLPKNAGQLREPGAGRSACCQPGEVHDATPRRGRSALEDSAAGLIQQRGGASTCFRAGCTTISSRECDDFLRVLGFLSRRRGEPCVVEAGDAPIALGALDALPIHRPNPPAHRSSAFALDGGCDVKSVGRALKPAVICQGFPDWLTHGSRWLPQFMQSTSTDVRRGATERQSNSVSQVRWASGLPRHSAGAVTDRRRLSDRIPVA